MALDLCEKNGFRVISFEYIALLDSYFIHRYIIIKHISYWLNILRLKEGNLIKKNCMWIDIDKLWVGIVYALNGANL